MSATNGSVVRQLVLPEDGCRGGSHPIRHGDRPNRRPIDHCDSPASDRSHNSSRTTTDNRAMTHLQKRVSSKVLQRSPEIAGNTSGLPGVHMCRYGRVVLGVSHIHAEGAPNDWPRPVSVRCPVLVVAIPSVSELVAGPECKVHVVHAWFGKLDALLPEDPPEELLMRRAQAV
jgi:hypothetical protein